MRRPHEFTLKTKTLASERAKGCCERCGAKLFPGKIRYDHQIPIAFGGESILENCCCVCVNCDAPKTKADIKQIAQAKRNYQKHRGIKKASRFACSRTSKWKKKLDGTVVKRD